MFGKKTNRFVGNVVESCYSTYVLRCQVKFVFFVNLYALRFNQVFNSVFYKLTYEVVQALRSSAAKIVVVWIRR